MAALLAAAVPAHAETYTVERVAMLMRHGVRPPTKEPAMPAGTAAAPWPRWAVPPGELTAHGAAAVRLLGAADRRALRRAGLLDGRGCPADGTIAILSDSDQRTIATGDAWAEGFAPGCRIDNRHRPQDEPDPIFSPIASGLVEYDPRAADAAVAAALPIGGIASLDARERPFLARLDTILCGAIVAGCGVGGTSSGIRPASPTDRPKLTGALDRGSTAAQILLLEYAEGRPAVDVGWGRARADDIERLGELHAIEFAVLARPRYVAARNLAPIARLLRLALSLASPKVTVIVGHDTNVANLGGLLDVHWQAPGFAADDPAPGGAIVATVLRSSRGERFVRLTYRAQSLETIRLLRARTSSETLPVPGCGSLAAGLCPLDEFLALLDTSASLPYAAPTPSTTAPR